MTNFWETKFRNEGLLWNFEPSDSAGMALELFKTNQIQKILIPGVGYGRNAKLFVDQGFDVAGIEISKSAIELARQNGLHFPVHCGSVTEMPFDQELFDGIFCYALIHLLNKPDRRKFLQHCFNQLKPGRIMVFTMASTEMSMYGQGKRLSKDRFSIQNGLTVFFYNQDSVVREFLAFGLTECQDIAEPVKFKEGENPIHMYYVVCKKQ
ncbi:MAG: class I SAM-dependent methyltransferase [Prolixibacteraceae bacterium]